ncbi:hypothetical protein [Streptomyces sp. NPDC048644]|uniref:hypothetical protein n=1 Tax=Streptomyces sp. NPDC048644 TaxID=3365582 RepID=UPI00372385C3
MSARDEIRRYVSLLGDSWTPRETTDARVQRVYAAVRAEVLREAADTINALPQDYECDPGRGDAADLLRRMADEAGKDTREGESTRAAIVAERDTQIVAWLHKKAREYRSTGSRQHALQAETIDQMASKIQRGAVRPEGGGAV